MPDYISSLGGEDYKGFIIGVFTVIAALSRPVSGKLADSIGRLPVMFFGGIICVIVSFLYPWFTTVFGFLALRFFHGMSTGFMPTGNVAYLADVIPDGRRGEAMGIAGIMNNIGFLAGNACSSIIANQYGVQNLFYFSGLLALLSVAILLKLKESLPNPEPFKINRIQLRIADLYDSRAKDPAITMFLTTMAFGAMLTLIPDYSKALGIHNKGTFFIITTISTIGVRVYAGSLSDRIGRIKTTMIGTFAWLLCTLLLVSLNKELFYAAAVLMGIATGMNSPTIFAWAVDVANGVKSGRAMATLFIAMELGITLGALASAAIYANEINRLQYVFAGLSVCNLLALLFLIIKNKSYNSVNQ